MPVFFFDQFLFIKFDTCVKFASMKNADIHRSKFTLEKVRSAALSVTSRSEFSVKFPGEYQWAWRNKLLDDICQHMPISPIYSSIRWDRESSMQEALKYKSRSEFKRLCSGAYCHAKDQGFLDDACAHMQPTYKKWCEKSVAKEAAKYKTRTDFGIGSYKAYMFAIKNKIIDSVCAHMEQKLSSWDKESVMLEASKYTNRGDFRAASGAYKHAYRFGFIDEACAHMEPGKCGFDPKKPAILYYLKIKQNCKNPLYKIGITNRDAKLRIYGMGIGADVTVEIIKEFSFERGVDARALEKSLHSKFDEFRYTGDPVMANGNTELFTTDVLSNFSIQENRNA